MESNNSYKKAYEYVHSIKQAILHKNRFFLDNSFANYLDLIIKDCTETIDIDTVFYRARRYEKTDVFTKWDEGILSSERFKGFTKEESDLNPKPMTAGRCNPKGIGYLYAATDIDTAILEVCNKRNTPVSVAEAKIVKKMTAVNLANDIQFGRGEIHSEEELERFEFAMAVKSEIASEMNRTFFDEHEYLLTQYICEYIKNQGIDSVIYQSTSHAGDSFEPREGLSDGNNIVIFNRNVYDIISSDLYLVRNIQIEKVGFNTKEI